MTRLAMSTGAFLAGTIAGVYVAHHPAHLEHALNAALDGIVDVTALGLGRAVQAAGLVVEVYTTQVAPRLARS